MVAKRDNERMSVAELGDPLMKGLLKKVIAFLDDPTPVFNSLAHAMHCTP